ncbi:DUF4177 domain-containing protein [candidate division WOR-3 bacterium]|uniref:DUF4177 domain-containing protein n=1 Tax=candidate division WOR-3 bacterium TaxID=2052148 RepID=A0A937XJ17_UNCW3|nr:DUF4177 domain-containing protein [candidate division WOR-3 bacterium]
MTKWEYKFVRIDVNLSPILNLARWGVQVPGEKKPRDTMEGVQDYISTFGAEGWELVSVISGSEQTGIITRAVLFFKRPVQS